MRLQSAWSTVNKIDSLFLNLRKAFDVVPDNLLCLKLYLLGIPEYILGWIKDYLHLHKRQVVLNGVTSAPMHMLLGVPQGSVLGPLLFLLYHPMKCHVLQADLEKVSIWCNR